MNDGSKIAAALFAVKSVSLNPTGNPVMVRYRLWDEYRRSSYAWCSLRRKLIGRTGLNGSLRPGITL
jgi:hypothetical protein